MTKPKNKARCPLCKKELHNVARHLREHHKVSNSKERAILNSMARDRVSVGAGLCPVPSCRKSVQTLSRHIWGHQELSVVDRDRHLFQLKRAQALAQLSLLRLSDPKPPMISRLDLDDGLEEGGVAAPEVEGPEMRFQVIRRKMALLKVSTSDLRSEQHQSQ